MRRVGIWDLIGIGPLQLRRRDVGEVDPGFLFPLAKRSNFRKVHSEVALSDYRDMTLARM